MTVDPRLRTCLLVALLLGGTRFAHAQQSLPAFGTVVNPAPMYLTPDPSRIPLATLPAGSSLRVLTREGDWFRVVFRDRYLGDRTGYVLAANIRLEPPPPAAAPPRPAVPGQVAPATPGQQAATTTAQQLDVEREDRGYLWLSGTIQQESTAFSATSTFSRSGGTGTIITNYDGVRSQLLDIALGQRVWNGLSVGVAVTWASQITDAAVSASVPHPAPSGSARTVSGIAPGIRRQELGLHVNAAYAVPTHGRVQVAVFAGPSLLRVRQGLVTGVTVNETPPFDTATFASATVVESRRQRVGYNAGVEASVRLWKALGVGVLVRYSHAELPFAPAPGAEVTLEAGGLQIGGGLHFRF